MTSSPFIKSISKNGFAGNHGKLCFEALETPLVPQNNLPLHRAEKNSKVVF